MTPTEALRRIRRTMPLAQLRLDLGGPEETPIWSAAVIVTTRWPQRERVVRRVAGATEADALGRLVAAVEGA